MVAGGLSGALAAASCCILPLALFSLGVSGAWIGTLTQLASYQPFFIVATLACLGHGHWLVYCSSKAECAEGEQCARPLSNWLVRLGLNLTTDDLKSTMLAYPTGPWILATCRRSTMILQSVITCPHCAMEKPELMPTDACQFFYICTSCGATLRPKAGDCCVSCSYGSVPCPPIQAERLLRPAHGNETGLISEIDDLVDRQAAVSTTPR